MSTIQTLVTLGKADVPAGRSAAGYLFLLALNASVVESKQVVDPSAVTFTVEIPGDYTVSVVRLLDDGSPLGDQISATITIVGEANVPVELVLSLA